MEEPINKIVSTKIEVCEKVIRQSFGFVKHYFLRIPEIGIEIHPGHYTRGTHHNLDTTKNYRVYATKIVCPGCLSELQQESNDMSYVWYYPFINCETLTKGLTGQVAISIQVVLYVLLALCIIASIFKSVLYVFAILVVALGLVYNNYLNCGSRLFVCHHIEQHLKEREKVNPPKHQ